MRIFSLNGEKALFTNVNGEKRMARGKHGEAAVIKRTVPSRDKYTGYSKCKNRIKPSTVGEDAVLEIEDIPEYNRLLNLHLIIRKLSAQDMLR